MNILRSKRVALGLRLKEAAAQASCDPGNLSRIEQGKQMPSITLARRLADIYGLTLDEVFSKSSTPTGRTAA
jgi:transcriptional regulator with XRE-family HTH domain